MFKNYLVVMVLSLLIIGTVGSTSLYSKVQVGEEISQTYETTHPYDGVQGTVWQQEFHWPNAGYIAIHFSQFDLAPGDYVQISSPDGKYSYTYQEKGKVVRGGETVLSNFWATHIQGDTAIVRLISNNNDSGTGFVIDKWVRGYEQNQVMAATESVTIDEAVGITPESEIESLDKLQYQAIDEKSKAVARLLINGKYAGAGFLIGCEGHIMTTYDCIGSQEDADNTDFLFMPEYGSINGKIEASSGTFIQGDQQLDYALILLPSNITETYGYLQFSANSAELGETLYTPSHLVLPFEPLAVISDLKENAYALVYSVDSSKIPGAPLLSKLDESVVAIDWGRGQFNRGTPASYIITHLGDVLPENAIFSTSSVPPTPTIRAPQGDAITNDCTPRFRWNAVTATPSVDYYEIRVVRDFDHLIVVCCHNVGNVTAAGCPVTLEPYRRYFWRVRAHNRDGYSYWSTPAYFWTPTSCN